MSAYYNEHDRFAAEWLRQLIKAGHIADGEVDERSIEDVHPDELRAFTQCHFFAGIGVWSYALRQAGWPDDRPVWTGSCPCQPFSAAGKRGGVADERHLWPALFHHISQLRPLVFFGEQVASKDGLAWFDTVSDDLEAASYTIGAADLCAAGFGAPHIRQRLYFVADANDERSQGRLLSGDGSDKWAARTSSLAGPLDNASNSRRNDTGECERRPSLLTARPEQPSIAGGVENAGPQPKGRGLCRPPEGPCQDVERTSDQSERPSTLNLPLEHTPSEQVGLPRCTWFDGRPADWLPCIDGKSRPVEPGTFPLAHGVTNRVGRLRGYGNALVAPVAQGFIEAYLETQS